MTEKFTPHLERPTLKELKRHTKKMNRLRRKFAKREVAYRKPEDIYTLVFNTQVRLAVFVLLVFCVGCVVLVVLECWH